MSIEAVIPRQVEQNRLVNQFSRMLVLGLGMDDYLSQINHTEMEYRPEFVEAVDYTTFLIRRCIFSAFLDILDHGDTTMMREAVEVLEVCRKYRQYEIAAITIKGNAQDVFNRIDHFVKDTQALDYTNAYGIGRQ